MHMVNTYSIYTSFTTSVLRLSYSAMAGIGALTAINSIDDLASTAPTASGASRQPRRSYFGRIGTGIAALAAMAYLGSAQMAKAAGMQWNINTGSSLGEYNLSNPGAELMLVYTVENNSDPDDGNNMVSVTVNAGANQGVYNAVAPGWSIEYGVDYTKFYNNTITPDNSGTFTLYSTQNQTQQGTAIATAGNYGNPVEFPPIGGLPVTVPVPEPGTTALVLTGVATLLRKKLSGAINMAKNGINSGVNNIRDSYTKSFL